MSSSLQDKAHGPVSRLVRRVGGGIKTSLAVVGAAAALAAYKEYRTLTSVDEDSKEKQKKVLVLPFHRLKLVDYQKTRPGDFPSLDREDRVQTMEVRELVRIIHEAAADPEIVALYGYFGHGGNTLAQTGWADLEEVRNALR